MYVLKARCLLSQRYTVHFLDHVQTLTRPVFATPCSYNNTVMRAPLRERIQHAINKATNNDSSTNNNNNNNDSSTNNNYYNNLNDGDNGVLIVGGRRRNRKKRSKKNGSKKKKSPSLDSIKNKLSPSSCRKGKDKDNVPLIQQGNKENLTTMPLFGKKKKPAPEPDTGKEGQAVKMENGAVDAVDGAVASQEAKAENGVAEGEGTVVAAEKEVDAKTSNTFAAGVTDDPKEEVEQDGSRATTEESNPQPAPVKTEKSPLIGQLEPQELNVKESKLRDHSPGFLCCSIL